MRGSRSVSRWGWAFGVIAPWQLGAILAVSLPADAGQEVMSGASLAPVAIRAVAAPEDLIPAQTVPALFRQGDEAAPPSGAGPFSAAPRILREISLSIEVSAPAHRLADEIEPRAVRKNGAADAPAIDRSGRSDPAAPLRPTFDARLRLPGSLARLRMQGLYFEHDETSPVSGLEPGDPAGPESVEAFEPWPDGESPTTSAPAASAPAGASGASPGESPTVPTPRTVAMRPASINERLMQGATPLVPRAAALASTTPAPADATPVEVAALAPSARAEPDETSTRLAARPAPASLIERDDSGREQRCLAEAVYFEARGESEEGQAAVAQVVLNRVASGLYPSSVCGVVYQNRRRHNACQFSFACDGRSLRVSEPEAWRTASRVAAEVLAGKTYVADVGGSTHYHASYVRPRWARSLEKMDVIGRHIFYKLRPGQT